MTRHLATACLVALLAATPAVATPLPVPESPDLEKLSAEELAQSRKRYMQVLVLPGAVLGVSVIALTIVLANRARRRQIEGDEIDDARR